MTSIETISPSPVGSSRSVVRSKWKALISLGLLIGGLVFLFSKYKLSSLSEDLHALTASVLAVAFLALVTNAVLASLRFKVIAEDMGQKVPFREALRTVSASGLAGAIFFHLAGQLIARGAIMSRSGVSFESVVVITLYERAVAAILSALIAIAGAYVIFGQIYVDPAAGGTFLIKLSVALVSATLAGVAFGYGRAVRKMLSPRLSRTFGVSLAKVVILTALVQFPVMAAYVSIAHALAPPISFANLIAASAIVMFAASIPISLSGWGVREMSAVAALGLIGVSGHAAFTTAALIGIGSLIAMGLVGGATFFWRRATIIVKTTNAQPKISYAKVVSWFFPLAAATFVPFQVYLPVGTGLLNVNLADPIAILGASLFAVNAARERRVPLWRAQYINTAVVLATLVLTESLLAGIGTFGLTNWAWINRYIGWFVLLSYGATGAMIVKGGREEGLRVCALTYVGAITAVSGLDMLLLLINKPELTHSPDVGFGIEGFSQNHNFLAFQLLMATAAVLVFLRAARLQSVLLGILFAAFWFTGSRSGWLSLVVVLAAALYIRSINFKELSRSLAVGILTAIFITCGAPALHYIWVAKTHGGGAPHAALKNLDNSILVPSSGTSTHGGVVARSLAKSLVPQITPGAADNQERLLSWRKGYELFAEHPLFGAGLGAFRNLNLLSTSGIPLLIHSSGLWLLAELGVVGFLSFFIPFCLLLMREWKSAKTDRTSALIVLSMIAFASMSIPADMVYQRTFWFIMGAALALVPSKESALAEKNDLNLKIHESAWLVAEDTRIPPFVGLEFIP